MQLHEAFPPTPGRTRATPCLRAISAGFARAGHVTPRVLMMPVGRGHGRIELPVRVGKPLWPSVVEVGQGSLLERGRRLPIKRSQPPGTARNGSSTHSTHSGGLSQRSRSSASARVATVSRYREKRDPLVGLGAAVTSATLTL